MPSCRLCARAMLVYVNRALQSVRLVLSFETILRHIVTVQVIGKGVSVYISIYIYIYIYVYGREAMTGQRGATNRQSKQKL